MSPAEAAAAAYILLNLISFAVYGIDKRRAVKGEWRIKESTLLLLGLIAPWGAVAGMHAFRHKTRKRKFLANYVFLVLHIAAIILILTA
ncbi:hypothetical protein AUQ37_01655 [Candidatus Methanomethylophilus sp. 1R26]|jgi:uncharacterized membrane protein YsdA (DUF1294 family)|uniref:DUF1294 domain-containing protein n=1 Tax=Candidatus Methanomethylophilus sp. 1R26 TaxID=1769296 RepID=UPI000736BF86|nr:DUF1294 domain-containing protein [Candidatus Methanomethylophilus sp. 1R26]MCH3978651.1 DUF1294 domain-containing protein [Methanomethylophilus sp.]TQS78974.1 MAG: hypothetical protein A3Q59_01300 [Methanomethylophilus alvi]WII09397.1 DUF1294 domain-containing protein [Methanomassiliicoccales archaeon LGM-DZ1]KUE73639.1 hypothetical protein AUQ37_01655 [Candidatus Methanomethylophilus sp. 1R26]MCI2074208.1 DUF1294 domain-containing protein [Methanomethylophilus sp.]